METSEDFAEQRGTDDTLVSLKNPSKNGELDQQASEEEEEEFVREKWSKKVEFFLSAIGYAVGLGNVWRFPYLCFKHGGGAFLVPYILMLIICGMPLFLMELALGQYISLGPVSSWAAICPIAKGIGFSMMIISFLCTIYYNVIIAWCLYYLSQSLRSEVPWKDCDNEWNTDKCATTGRLEYDIHVQPSIDAPTVNSSYFTNSSMCVNNTISYAINETTTTLLNCSLTKRQFTSPSSEYWENNVLHLSDGIGEAGPVRWQLVICLILAWILVYFCLWKGIKSSGKVVYFTATFPYLILVILFFRGITLSGASKGIIYYIKPDFSKLADADVWVAAATQIFYSLGIGFGSLVTYGSYNKFNNDCVKDAVIVTIINCSTSIFSGFVIFSVLGHMAHILNKEVPDVATSGPGLAFVVYPEAIAQMPISPLWAMLFFFMLLTLGLDTQFAMMEAVVTGLVDEYKFLRKRKELVIMGLCALAFIIGLTNITEGGAYVLNLFNIQAGGISLLFLAFFEVITISWGYGTDRFVSDIERMVGRRILPWWAFAWKYFAPTVILGIFIFSLYSWKGVAYGDYQYPQWAEFFGWVLALSSMLWVPCVAIYMVARASGASFREKLKVSFLPNDKIAKENESREGCLSVNEELKLV